MKKFLQNKKGSALVEYGLLIAGVALVAAAAVSVFGHKTNDLIAATATVLPGAHDDDNGPIVSGKVIETNKDGRNGSIILDDAAIAAAGRTLGNNVLGTVGNTAGTVDNVLGETLVIEANGD